MLLPVLQLIWYGELFDSIKQFQQVAIVGHLSTRFVGMVMLLSLVCSWEMDFANLLLLPQSHKIDELHMQSLSFTKIRT
jgi:hypothetical protein